jgi:hypothetical protein
MNNTNMTADSGEWFTKKAIVTPPIQVSRNRLGSNQKTTTGTTIQAAQAGDNMDISGADGNLSPKRRVQACCQAR